MNDVRNSIHFNKSSNKYELREGYGVGWTNKGYEFHFDLDDYEKIKDYKWHKHQDGYLRTCIGTKENGKNKYILMHKLILEDFNNDFEIDHEDGNSWNNRKYNLRKGTHNSNMKNLKLYKSNKTGHKGVYFAEREGKYKATIQFNKKKIHLGTFTHFKDAVKIREEAEMKYFGEWARDKENLKNGTR